MLKIGLDAMGGDFAPLNAVLGAIDASAHKDIHIWLFGDREIITGICNNAGFDPGRFVIVDCKDNILFTDHPVSAFHRKRESSIVKGFQLLESGDIDAFASAGNTGAMMIGCSLTLNMINKISRPCISVELPLINGNKVLLLDVGFNADCRPDNLLQFGALGNIYSKSVLGVKEPKVGLLNIGAESGKGNLNVKEAYTLFSEGSDFNFIGNIEPDNIFTDSCADVVVTDGFTGNLFLKQAEALYNIVCKREIEDAYLSRFNYELYGGTAVLGVSSVVIIGHGRSSSAAIANMIFKAESVLKSRLIENFNIFA